MDMLAFSSTLPGNDNEPVEVITDKTLIAKQDHAEKELAALNDNDATSAFGALVMAQEIQTKTEALMVKEQNGGDDATEEQAPTPAPEPVKYPEPAPVPVKKVEVKKKVVKKAPAKKKVVKSKKVTKKNKRR